MATTYTPAVADADEDAFTGQAFDDPIVYTSANNKRVDSKYHLKPHQDETLGLIKGRVSSMAYRITWTCGVGDAVGSPVRISGNDTVTTALATSAANSKVIGFIRYKPTTTTCFIDHYVVATGLSGLTAGGDVFLTNAGSFSASAGTYRKSLGVARTTTSAVLYANSRTASNNAELFDDAEGDAANVSMSAASDGISTFAARRDHVHLLADAAVTLAKLESRARPATNYLINGGFDFSQRFGSSVSSNLATDAYSADRWRVLIEATNCTYTRIDNTATSGQASRFSGRFTKNVAGGKLGVCQIIEGVNTVPLRGRSVTFQARVKSSANMTIKMALLELAGGTIDTIPANVIVTWGATTADPTAFGANITSLTSVAKSVLSSGFTSFNVTATVSAATQNLIVAFWSESSMASTAWFEVEQAGLYDGASTREWLPRPTAEELVLCQRYYAKSYPILTVPGTASIDGFSVFLASSTALAYGNVPFPVHMRGTPNTAVHSYAGTASRASTLAGVDTAGGNVTLLSPTSRSATTISDAGSGLTAGTQYTCHWVAAAEL